MNISSVTGSMETGMQRPVQEAVLLTLVPREILLEIFGFFKQKEARQVRSVCVDFDRCLGNQLGLNVKDDVRCFKSQCSRLATFAISSMVSYIFIQDKSNRAVKLTAKDVDDLIKDFLSHEDPSNMPENLKTKKAESFWKYLTYLKECAANLEDFKNSFSDDSETDLALALKYYLKEADQGLAVALTNLDHCYNNGVGVAPNLTRAVQHYQMLADQGRAEAQNNLARCYANRPPERDA